MKLTAISIVAFTLLVIPLVKSSPGPPPEFGSLYDVLDKSEACLPISNRECCCFKICGINCHEVRTIESLFDD